MYLKTVCSVAPFFFKCFGFLRIPGLGRPPLPIPTLVWVACPLFRPFHFLVRKAHPLSMRIAIPSFPGILPRLVAQPLFFLLPTLLVFYDFLQPSLLLCPTFSLRLLMPTTNLGWPMFAYRPSFSSGCVLIVFFKLLRSRAPEQCPLFQSFIASH